jgi:transporter family protein
VAQINSNLATAIRTAVILVFTWTICLTTSSPKAILAVSWKSWQFLVLSGVTTGLSWLCYFRALQLGPASKIAPVDKLSVVFALVLAALLLHEQLNWQHWVGGGFVLLGAMILAI